MRKLVEAPLGELGFIADNAFFSGYLEDDNECLSDASFYEYDDDGTEDELASILEGRDTQILKKENLSKKNKSFSTAGRKVNGGRGKEKKLLKKIQKGSKTGIETSDKSKQQSASDSDVKSEQETSREHYNLLSKQQKLSKKLRDGSASFADFEVDAKVRRKEKSSEAMLKKRGTASVKVEFGSGIRSEKVKDAKIKEEYSTGCLDLREADAENGVASVQAFQRRKKLCKAVELTSAGQRHKSKGKAHPVETKGKTSEKGASKGRDHSFMEGVQRNKSDFYSSDSEAPITAVRESSLKGSPSKSFKQGLPKEQKFTKDEDGLVRAELPGEGRSTFLVRKGIKHRDLKHEDVAGSSSTGKQPGSNNKPMRSVVRSRKKDWCASLETVHNAGEHRRHAVEKVCDNGVAGEEVSSGVTEGADGNKEVVLDAKGSGDCNAEPAGTEVGWVMCDSCSQWRCIPASLADIIESTNCGWLCKDNPDKKFADCLVPQEKTNKEINEELDLSEVSFCEGEEKHPAIDSKLMNGIEHQSKLFGQLQSTWTLIKHNIFQHRRRKTQTIDEQMVCNCVPPEDGVAGCGEDCLNRMLSIECVSQTCPCGDGCSNQQFQRRLYTKVSWFRCGKKGFGLQVLEDVSKGAFIIEYVGEVLDMSAYEGRQKDYAMGGQKHFYFMTLSGSEVIDACVKGNLGRFINHSCEPNCRTEKWMVNGEVCIGLFAIRDLKKGEEITFDYNFVRVCGAAAKKCLCGSRDCRGFIGGDPMTPRSVVHNDSEDDDPEPIMIEESSEEESRIEDGKLAIEQKRDEKAEAIPPIELRNKERDWMLSESSERQAVTFKQAKAKATVKKLSSTTGKALTIDTSGGRFEGGVEESLNALVDENGSLCKGQANSDEIATYLKLLVMMTAMSGDTANGEGSRSTRELSMVLDALLKTQSRAILVEVINLNGLQVLHKMIQKSRKDYKRTPIIRKLLKVLEFLAVKRVLTTEQINAEPTCFGAESVKDTICHLCRHADMEVQQMAHQFREKWLKGSSHKPLRRGQGLSSDLSKWRLFPKLNENSGAGAAADDETKKKRKRPSRWDQPSQEVLDTTMAGGLPQSFWPFNANNLLVGGSQQNSVTDQPLRQTGGAVSDELGAMHPGPPSFPVTDNQHHVDTAHIGTDIPGVVSGIPVEQFSAGSSMGYMAQQGSICIGIPVTQFHATRTPGTDCSFVPRMFTSTHQVNHPPDGQAMPFSSNMPDVQEQRNHEFDVEPPPDKAAEEPNITFGISHSQFFQQMHGMFGSAFHPWQLQSLMAPHAWGPYLSGDARIRDIGFLNESVCRQPAEYRGLEESAGKPVESNGPVGYLQDAEPPVPGLSPPLPPPPPLPPTAFAYPSPPVHTPKRTNGGRPYMGNDHLARGSAPHQQLKSSSWKPQRWNSPRWPRFQGNNKYRNPGFRRDMNYMQRNNRPNFPRPGPIRSHNDWEDSSSRQQHPAERSWGYSNSRGTDHEESMDMDADGGFNGPYGAGHNEPFQDTGNQSGAMPLERPWGYGQDEYAGGDPNTYPREFSQERVKDTVNSWGVNN